eukprot:gnl/MRDRNA2_/MRDRNA2_78255_c0_seq1.p1 gnl/MRDRNA2_/MRDRNA2_78255_c0~~gnl/MRDRNA2_/MRDRNA2_78255_c0_seq1.p1  ORF type:complete len:342 (-),score=5.51 gnl/MRDRNA2_/MRDRNA2_78255_c0_seq1:399-1424(-)
MRNQRFAKMDCSKDTVSQKTMLVVGATGSLGRQIVRSAMAEGFDVRCVVRPREIPADFLRDWGATVVNADLTNPSTIPATMVGVHTVIDASTARPEESIESVDWLGKIALVQSAQAMCIQKFVFFSIFDCDKHPSVPLMNIKACTEAFIRDAGLDYIIIRLCGFMQAVIGNYAIPILEERSVWGTDDKTRTAYIDTQDVSKLTLGALTRPDLIGMTITLAGPESWTTSEVINLCDSLSRTYKLTREVSKAKVTRVPIWLLRGTRILLSCFEWTENAADRLAFTETERQDYDLKRNDESLKLLGVDRSDITTLELYLRDYYSKIMKKLKEVGAESRQTDFYV